MVVVEVVLAAGSGRFWFPSLDTFDKMCIVMNAAYRKFFLILAILGLLIISPTGSAFSGQRDKPTVSFGFIPMYTPHQMYERFQPLLDYLSANTPFRFKMRLAKDYKGIVALLKDGSINVALLGGVSYIIARDNILQFFSDV